MESAKEKAIREAWVDIKGFEGYYQVNLYGKVKALKRTVRDSFHPMTLKERLMTISNDKDGYKFVRLSKGNKKIKMYQHRLIGIHFIDNPKNLPCINHKDGNKINNSIDNLEWCSYLENNRHAFETGLNKKGKESHLYGKKGALCHNSKKVTDFSTGIIYDSVTIAAEVIGVSRSHLSAMLTGIKKNKTTYQYTNL